MITKEKIKIYKRYGGDIDGWARSGSRKEKSVMNDNDWYIIDGLLQDLTLAKKGLTSLSFNDDLNSRLEENCENKETIQTLKAMTD
ncbi:MAG: hypothetical protein LCH81_06985 [Bacteroidetes bacterium]|nr:hypothetical protein [Bacteroidota bacterium]